MGRWKWSESLVYSNNSGNSNISVHYSGCLPRAHGFARTLTDRLCIPTFSTMCRWKWSEPLSIPSIATIATLLDTTRGVCPVLMELPNHTNHTCGLCARTLTDPSCLFTFPTGSLEMVGIPRIFRQVRKFRHFWTPLGVSAPCLWVCQIIQITHDVDLCARTMTDPPCIPTFPTVGRWKWSGSFVYSDN